MNRPKIIFVSGSTKGIGYRIAKNLQNDGNIVITNGRSKNDEFEHHIQMDLSILDNVKKTTKLIRKKYKKLDIIINNAAFTKFIEPKKLNKLNDDLFNNIIGLNLKSYFFLINNFLPIIGQSNESLVVNMASIAGHSGMGSNAAYSASKAGVINITKFFAKNYAPIRFNSISPGLIKTNFVKFPKDYYTDTISKTPLKRSGTPEDIYDVVKGLIEMKFVTGQDIIVDGGLTL